MNPGTVTSRITEVGGKEQVTATSLCSVDFDWHVVLEPAGRPTGVITDIPRYNNARCQCVVPGRPNWRWERVYTQNNHHQPTLTRRWKETLHNKQRALAHDTFACRQPSIADTVWREAELIGRYEEINHSQW